jgi:hypothetical protein
MERNDLPPDNRETPERRIPPEVAPVSVKPVGTFAAGQSVQGSIPVVVGAEVGSFASEDEDPTTGADEDRATGAA